MFVFPWAGHEERSHGRVKTRIASHEPTIVQIITSPWRRPPPRRNCFSARGYHATPRKAALTPTDAPARARRDSRPPAAPAGGNVATITRDDERSRVRSRRQRGEYRGASLAGGRVRCGCVFSEPIRAPIRAARISDRETVKPTWSDASSSPIPLSLLLLLMLLLLQQHQHQQQQHRSDPLARGERGRGMPTHNARSRRGLATGIESGALFFFAHERRKIICIRSWGHIARVLRREPSSVNCPSVSTR
jgi:hypothetical protein